MLEEGEQVDRTAVGPGAEEQHQRHRNYMHHLEAVEQAAKPPESFFQRPMETSEEYTLRREDGWTTKLQ